MAQLPHTPSYDSGATRPQRTVKKRMEDGTIHARVKSAPLWEVDVTYKSRPINEFLDIEEFYETYGEHTSFEYEHFLTGEIYDVFFASPPQVTNGSFDSVDFGFKIVEDAGGVVTLPTVSSLPEQFLRIDYDFHNVAALGDGNPIVSINNAAPLYPDEVLDWMFSSGLPLGFPTLKVGQINGKAVARFDGTNDALQTADVINLNDFTYYIVFKPQAQMETTVVDFGYPAMFARQYGGTMFDFMGQTYDYSNNAWHIAYGGRLASNAYIFDDGVTVGTKVASGAPISDVISVGTTKDAYPPTGGFMQGDIARVIIYDQFLNSLKRHQVYNYLKTLYAL